MSPIPSPPWQPDGLLERIVVRARQRLWRYAPTYETEPYLLHARMAYPFRHLQVAVDDPQVVASFAQYNQQPQDEHLIWYKQPLLFEPSYGFALTGPHTLLLESMPYYERVGLPSFLPYVSQRCLKRTPVQHERCVISLREFGDDNYYHFYSDVLGRLALLDRCHISEDIPILVSRRLYDRQYFQQALGRSALKSRRWIIHDGFVQADEAILCKVMPHSKMTFDWMLQALQCPRPDIYSERRILLVRPSTQRRHLENQAHIARICAEFGFEMIDTDQLDLDAQMHCFASARYIVGIHGAGLINCIFRRGAPLSLLELFPADNIPPHYYWICQNYGFAYDALVGTSTNADESFVIDEGRLRAKLTQMVRANALPMTA